MLILPVLLSAENLQEADYARGRLHLFSRWSSDSRQIQSAVVAISNSMRSSEQKLIWRKSTRIAVFSSYHKRSLPGPKEQITLLGCLETEGTGFPIRSSFGSRARSVYVVGLGSPSSKNSTWETAQILILSSCDLQDLGREEEIHRQIASEHSQEKYLFWGIPYGKLIAPSIVISVGVCLIGCLLHCFL